MLVGEPLLPLPLPPLPPIIVLFGFVSSLGFTTLSVFDLTFAFADKLTTFPEICEPVIVTSPLA